MEVIKSFYEQVQINPSSVKVSKVKQVFDMSVCSTCFKIPQQICVFLIPCGVTPLHHINKTFEPFQHQFFQHYFFAPQPLGMESSFRENHGSVASYL